MKLFCVLQAKRDILKKLLMLVFVLLSLSSCAQKTVQVNSMLNIQLIEEKFLKVDLESNTIDGTVFALLISNDKDDSVYSEYVTTPFSKVYSLTEWPTSNISIQTMMSLQDDFNQPMDVKKLYGKNGKNMVGEAVTNYVDGSGKVLVVETRLEYENNLPPLEYELITDYWGDPSFGSVIRIAYNVIVPVNSDEEYVLRVASDIVRKTTVEKDINAITLFFYDDKDTDLYKVAKIDWAPYGEWSSANEVTAGNYEHHELKVVYYTGIEERQKKHAEYKAYIDSQ